MPPRVVTCITVHQMVDGESNKLFRINGAFPAIANEAVNRVIDLRWELDSLKAEVDEDYWAGDVTLAFRERVRQAILDRQNDILLFGVIPGVPNASGVAK